MGEGRLCALSPAEGTPPVCDCLKLDYVAIAAQPPCLGVRFTLNLPQDLDDDEEDEESDQEGWQNHTLAFQRTAEDIRSGNLHSSIAFLRTSSWAMNRTYLRREKAERDSLETKDDRQAGQGDRRSFHERRPPLHLLQAKCVTK